jgi:integrase
MLVLGLRSDEVRELLWSNVRPETPEWSNVDPDEAEFNKSLRIQWTKRRFVGDEAQSALLPLPSLCLIALKFQNKQQKDWQGIKINEWHSRWCDSQPIFTTRSGIPFEPRTFNQHFTDRCQKAGVRCIEPQVLRRTCASLLAALDVPPSRAKQILSHSEPAAEKSYTELPNNIARDARERLEKNFDDRLKATTDEGEAPGRKNT